MENVAHDSEQETREHDIGKDHTTSREKAEGYGKETKPKARLTNHLLL